MPEPERAYVDLHLGEPEKIIYTEKEPLPNNSLIAILTDDDPRTDPKPRGTGIAAAQLALMGVDHRTPVDIHYVNNEGEVLKIEHHNQRGGWLHRRPLEMPKSRLGRVAVAVREAWSTPPALLEKKVIRVLTIPNPNAEKEGPTKIDRHNPERIQIAAKRRLVEFQRMLHEKTLPEDFSNLYEDPPKLVVSVVKGSEPQGSKVVNGPVVISEIDGYRGIGFCHRGIGFGARITRNKEAVRRSARGGRKKTTAESREEGISSSGKRIFADESFGLLSDDLMIGAAIVESATDALRREEDIEPCKVFISYKSQDSEKVEDIADLLYTDLDIAPWRDKEELEPGDEFPLKIRDAIENCEVLLFVVSKEALEGTSDDPAQNWPLQEWLAAEGKTRIIVDLDGYTQHGTLPKWFKEIRGQYEIKSLADFDFSKERRNDTPGGYNNELEDLLNRRGILGVIKEKALNVAATV